MVEWGGVGNNSCQKSPLSSYTSFFTHCLFSADERCPGEYFEIYGSVPGRGQINGKGNHKKVAGGALECAQLCDSEETCVNFEFMPSQKKCQLNTEHANPKGKLTGGLYTCMKPTKGKLVRI